MQTTRAASKAILFDLDGTLVDNFGAIHRSIVHAQEMLGLPPSSYDRVRTAVGGGIELTLVRLVGAELAPAALPHFQKFFPTVMLAELTPLPGAAWLLESLHARGIRQAVLTNKHGESARAIIRHLGWDKWVEAVIGDKDTSWKKPLPEFSLHALAKLGVTPEEAMMIGDSPFDLDAGSNAGLRSLAVTTGSHTREQLLAHQPPPEAVYDSLNELGVAAFGFNP